MTDTPIACTLSPEARFARRATIAQLATDALVARERTDDGARVRLTDRPDVERRARELIAAESACCPFLTFDLQKQDDELVLTVAGPPDAQPVIDELFR
jgi:hypothetical protein